MSPAMLCEGQSIRACVRVSFLEAASPYLDLTGGTDMHVLGKGRGRVFPMGFFLGSVRPYLALPEVIQLVAP